MYFQTKSKFCDHFYSLPNIMEEIAKEDEQKEKKRIRRTVVKEERLKSGPPRLGRYKYISQPTNQFPVTIDGENGYAILDALQIMLVMCSGTMVDYGYIDTNIYQTIILVTCVDFLVL